MAPGPEASTTPLEDADLMRRVQAGDEGAFASLMERWERPVKAVIARIVLNASEAEELAQETFVRLWHYRARFEATKPLKPWLLGIAVNLARNRLRWWKRRPVVALEEWMELPEQGSKGATGSEGTLETAERVQAVRDAIATLPVDLREALVLFEYEQLSHAEIAEAVGATAKAVETRIARARQKLRQALGRWQ